MKTTTATKWVKCSSCGEQIRTGERIITIEGSRDKFCEYCQENAELMESAEDNAAREHERQAEDYAAYRIAGCSQEYWNDRDAGYCR